MRNKLEEKFVNFVENTIDYKLANNHVNNKYNENYNGKYDLHPNQYEDKRRYGIWYVELEYNSTLDDDFYKKLADVFGKSIATKNPSSNLEDSLKNLIDNTNMTDKEYGHIFRYAWYFYEGRPFSNGVNIVTQNNTNDDDPNSIKNIGKIVIKFTKNYEKDRDRIKIFKDMILKQYEKISKQLEKQKKLKLTSTGISFTLIKSLIAKSTLHKDIKNEIKENIADKYQDIVEIIEDGLIVHDDTLFGSIGDENKWQNHFSKNLNNFPVNIITEHGTILYKAK